MSSIIDWQVLGRRETPAPYWIAGIQDGHGESYYTMGGRSELGLRNYFHGIAAAFRNLRCIASRDTVVVQLISFSDMDKQLSKYLEAMRAAGFEESSVAGLDSRPIRSVPNRKWYTTNLGHRTTPAAKYCSSIASAVSKSNRSKQASSRPLRTNHPSVLLRAKAPGR